MQLSLREARRKAYAKRFKMTGLVDKAVNHQGIRSDISGIYIRANDVIGPGCLEMGHTTGLCRIRRRRKRILKDPIFSQANVQINRIDKPVAPEDTCLRKLLDQCRSDHYNIEFAIVWQIDPRE